MIKIKMKTIFANPEVVIDAGKIGEVEDNIAKKLVEGGFAEYAEKPKEEKEEKTEKAIEVAIIEANTAVKPKPVKKKGGK